MIRFDRLLKKRDFMKLILFILFMLSTYSNAENFDGKKVFETYCWGCHHQTAMAFGPPFSQIAKTRTPQEIEAYIISPESMYKAFGYKRSVMTQFNLSEDERKSIVDYIISFKEKH